MHQFKNLDFWKRSRAFCSLVYQVTKDYPKDERFGLTNQLRRAAVSIPSNIAEGAAKTSKKDFNRFLEISLGSAYEVETQLLISKDLDYLTESRFTELNANLEIIIKQIRSFKKVLV